MIGACEATGVKLMTVFMKRFNWSFQRVKELIEEGRLGKVFEVRGTVGQCQGQRTKWRGISHDGGIRRGYDSGGWIAPV